ncbi:MAG: hypothetical protein HQL34_13875 [Alphaproteobacteria bacterium]|nr:hypothetical protein [Alphaproteobacteria bacterium]
MNGMPKALIAPAVMAASLLISCTTLPGSAAARTGADGTCVSVMVLADDADLKTMDSNSSVSHQVDEAIRENFSRFRNYVVTRSALEGDSRFNVKFNERMSESDSIRLMNYVKDSGKAAEFDVRFLVFYRLFPIPREKTKGFGDQIKIQIGGFVYDADAKRHIGNFGPETWPVSVAGDCTSIACVSNVMREEADNLAKIITDEARKKLMLITPECMEEPSQERTEIKGPPTAGPKPPEDKGGGTPRSREPIKLTTTYTVQFKHFTPTQFLAIKTAMNKEFPDFVRAGRVQGSAPIVNYGYTTQAPQEKIHEWLHMVLKDSDISPDLDAKISASGTTFKVEYLGSDLPEAPRRRKYDY